MASGGPIACDPRDDGSTHRRLPTPEAGCSSRPMVPADWESGCSGRDRPCKAPDCCMSHRSVEVLPVAVAARIPSLTRSWRDGTRKLSQTGCRQRMHRLLGELTVSRPLTSPALPARLPEPEHTSHRNRRREPRDGAMNAKQDAAPVNRGAHRRCIRRGRTQSLTAAGLRVSSIPMSSR